jgi:hypothetical protein
MNTIPCVYVATMKECNYGEKCRHAHYANQLSNIKYCNDSCGDVVVDQRNHYKNKKKGRVCLLKHEKESQANYIARTNMLPGGPSKIPQKVKLVVKATPTTAENVVPSNSYTLSNSKPSTPSTPSVFSLEMFPMLTVALKNGRNVKIEINSKVDEKEPTVKEVIEEMEEIVTPKEPVVMDVIEEIVTPKEPAVKEVIEVTVTPKEPVIDVAALTKKDKKKEYKKRKWLEAKLAEDAKLAEEKRIASEKAEKNRQKRAAKKIRQAEELAKVETQKSTTGDIPAPTEVDLMKIFKQNMLKMRINELKKGRMSKA